MAYHPENGVEMGGLLYNHRRQNLNVAGTGAWVLGIETRSLWSAVDEIRLCIMAMNILRERNMIFNENLQSTFLWVV